MPHNLSYAALESYLLLLEILIYRNLLAVSAHSLKLDGTVSKSKQGIIASAANISTGMDLRATLLDEDVACNDELSVGTLYAKTLRL